MKTFLYILGSIGAIILLFMMIFGLGLFGLEYKKFFAPKHANIDRQVFENTQSYTHGMIQDLAKYHEEYSKSDTPEDREAIRAIILTRFAQFDEAKIQAIKLRNFLTNMRGY